MSAADDLPSRASLAGRLSFYYASVFALIGAHLPFFPLWLDTKGVSPDQIGTLLAAVSFVRIVTTPWIGARADRMGERRRPMVALAVLATLGFAAYWAADGFWTLLVVGILAGVAHAGLMPLGENVALTLAPRRGLAYGRLRLWGSVAFIAIAALGGVAIDAWGIGLTIWMLVGTAAWTALACAMLPDIRSPSAAARHAPVRALLRNRTFVLLLATCGLLQASHAVFYALGTVHWRANGIDEATIGLLSAEAVVAEIALFAAGGWLLARLGPVGLLAISGVAGVLRWSAMVILGDIESLAVLQLLHAFTFGAAHLAGMHILARAAPEGYAATAQSTYSAIGGGIAMGLALLASGPLYAALGTGAYGVMAALSVLGLFGAAAFGRCWSGERLRV